MQKLLGRVVVFLFVVIVALGILSGFQSPAHQRQAPASSSSAQTWNASQAVVRIAQLDPSQYSSTQEYRTWAESACSATSMTEDINSYGHHYRIADILQVEIRLGEITPELGLVESSGIDRTVAQFGFQTETLSSPSLDEIIRIANRGTPVIVSFPPQRWPGGHLLLVRGGNEQSVFVVDSSSYNMTQLSRSKFLGWWAGFAVVATPKGGQ